MRDREIHRIRSFVAGQAAGGITVNHHPIGGIETMGFQRVIGQRPNGGPGASIRQAVHVFDDARKLQVGHRVRIGQHLRGLVRAAIPALGALRRDGQRLEQQVRLIHEFRSGQRAVLDDGFHTPAGRMSNAHSSSGSTGSAGGGTTRSPPA